MDLTLKNFGTMTERQLNGLLSTFPPKARIERTELTVAVYLSAAPGGKLLSAARLSAKVWHIRAVPGLITETARTVEIASR